MNLLAFFRGLPTVAKQEFLTNMKSIRLVIMVVILALVVVGGAYGLTSGTGGGSGLPSAIIWGHAAYAPGGRNLAVVWLSDPFGTPLPDARVSFSESREGAEVPIGELRTGADGFARLDVGNRTVVNAVAEVGTTRAGTSILWRFAPTLNFSAAMNTFLDLDNDDLLDDPSVHVVTRDGTPASARLYLNTTYVRDVDAHGYARLSVPGGLSNVVVEVAGERETFEVAVRETPGLSFGGPDFALLIMGAFFTYLIAPIFSIVLTFDAVSKERVQGTLDLLLSRPVSRTGVLLGKFLGAFAAVAVPVTLVNLVGIGVIGATSGKSPTGGFAGAFVAASFLLIAFYVLLQLIFSTLAKTSGTAVLFGVLVWLLFNVLYGIVAFVIGAVLFRDPADQFRFGQVAALGNPSSIYQQLIFLAAPRDLVGPFGGTTLNVGTLGVAAIVWLALLFLLALWTFHRKAAE